MSQVQYEDPSLPVQMNSKSVIGFWIYLMTDCIVFGTLFATYIVLQGATYGGPSGKDLFELPFVLIETLLLLTSSFTSGLVLLSAYRNNVRFVLLWLGITVALGLAFLGMELYEFIHLVQEGNSWQRSGFLSAFFTLVGTHGLHIIIGLLWALILFGMLATRGLSRVMVKRLTLFTLFWHFLDVIWIFIFTFVYLIGAQ